MLHVFGIPHCTTVKKARTWLDEHQLAYTFHDFKKEGARLDKLQRWAQILGWEKLLKKTGTTWRALPEEVKTGLDEGKALKLMQQYPNLIRRPIVELPDGRLLVGFDAAEYAHTLEV